MFILKTATFWVSHKRIDYRWKSSKNVYGTSEVFENSQESEIIKTFPGDEKVMNVHVSGVPLGVGISTQEKNYVPPE
jgi:hypothetical protein